jgi:archaellum biogenesis ATPase FlaH
LPYSIEDLKKAGLYKESAISVSGEIRYGKVIEDIPDLLKQRLSIAGGGRHNDASRQDSSDITALLQCGLNPSDTYATFAASIRGKDALHRKNSHFDDYLQRTIRAGLSFLGKTLEDYEPKSAVHIDFARRRSYKLTDGINVAMASGIETEKARWLWPGYIPSGKITILAGDPGMGKSTIAIDLVSRISCGKPLPSGGRTVTGTCLIASAEDAPEDTIAPRLIVAEAKMSKVGVIREVKIEDQLCYLSLPRDLNRLRKLVVARGARVLVIDPLNAFLERGTDSYKDQDIRSVLAPVENMAEETGVAVLIIAHLTKKEDSSVLYRVGGSIGFIGAARSVLAVGETGKKNLRVLYSLKSNLAKKPQPLGYETRQVTRHRKNESEWKGEEKIVSSVIRWKGAVEYDPSNRSAVNGDKAATEAENFLQQALTDSGVSVDDIYAEAKRAGISRGQLNRMKTEMGLKVTKGRDGNWTWSMP